jgi:hypothetical protein
LSFPDVVTVNATVNFFALKRLARRTSGLLLRTNGLSTRFQVRGLFGSLHPFQQIGVVLQVDSDFPVLWPEAFLIDGQGAQ